MPHLPNGINCDGAAKAQDKRDGSTFFAPHQERVMHPLLYYLPNIEINCGERHLLTRNISPQNVCIFARSHSSTCYLFGTRFRPKRPGRITPAHFRTVLCMASHKAHIKTWRYLLHWLQSGFKKGFANTTYWLSTSPDGRIVSLKIKLCKYLCNLSLSY